MGISNNQANALISSVVTSAGGNIDGITLSLSSGYRISDKIIREDAAILRSNISEMVTNTGTPVILHFDGKIIKDFTGATDETKDRLCVLIRFNNETHLLGVPGLDHGTGEEQFLAIQKLLDSFQIGRFLHGLCFDTTASNTGRLKGVCTRLAKFHGRKLLMLACRHHVGEIHIKHFSDAVAIHKTVGPQNPLFKSLKAVLARG